MRIRVAVSSGLAEPLTYEAPDDAGIVPGARVVVPLGRRLALGWVLGLDSPYGGPLKRILGIVSDPFVADPLLLEFALLAAADYFVSPANLLDLSLPPSQKGLHPLRLDAPGKPQSLDRLSLAGLEALARVTLPRFVFRNPAPAAAAAAPPPGYAPRLLLAAGREAEYRQAVDPQLAAGRSVILVAPDIATACHWAAAWPGAEAYHSQASTGERERIWRRCRAQGRVLACGGLSALLLPLADLGLLVVDRSASPLYRRAANTPFRLDHLAELRARSGRLPLLCGASSHTCATWERPPELQTVDRRPPPAAVEVHPLKGRERGIPARLLEMLRANVQAGRRTLVLVNRRQPARHLYCPACERLAACPACGGVLRLEPGPLAACPRCAFRRRALEECPRCRKPLESLADISIETLVAAAARACGEESLLALTAAELRDDGLLTAAASRPLVIATLAALHPRLQGGFAAALWVKPESFFAMEDYNAAEMIHAAGAEIAGTLAPGGEMHVFSVFHFHYALQHLADEAAFFARELKYRRWFLLPPLADVFELELREASLRGLARSMRALAAGQRGRLHVARAFLASRRPLRGSYRGVLEIHAPAAAVAAAGLPRLPRVALRRVAV